MNRRVTRAAPKTKSAPNKNRRTQGRPQSSTKTVKSRAQFHDPTMGGTFGAWLSHHQGSCQDAFVRFFQAPLQSLLICLVLAIALALPAALYSGLNSVNQISEQWQNHTRLSAYLHQKIKPLAMEQLRERLQAMPELETVELVTPEQAKQEFIQHSGLGELLQGLESNPLPAVLLIQPKSDVSRFEQLQQIRKDLEQEALIDNVQIDLEWLQRLQAMMGLVQRVIVALAILLIVGMLLNLANTIRLTIESRRKEIVVSKLVGATDAFIRRPFLYTGLCYGLGGGLIALVILQLLEVWLLPTVKELVLLYESEYSLSLLSLDFSAFLLGLSVILGLAAAWLAVLRTMRGIEPE